MTVEDRAGASDEASVSLDVREALSVTTSSLPGAVEGDPYEASLEATGGDGDYSWSVAGGSLPAGVSLSSDGVLSGVPAGDDATFIARVEDGADRADSTELTLAVDMRPDPAIVEPSRHDTLRQHDNGEVIGRLLVIDEWTADEEISFRGAAEDPDGQTDLDFRWVSSIDGTLSVEKSFDAVLSPGRHTIALEAVDPDGLHASVETEITVLSLRKTLSVAVHRDVRFSETDVTGTLRAAQDVLRRNDGVGAEGGDVSCEVELGLAGSVQDAPAYVPAIIDSGGDLYSATASSPTDVVVVDEISYCNGRRGDFYGCASGGDFVVADDYVGEIGGVLWAHEWGHTIGGDGNPDPGLNHRDDIGYVMNHHTDGDNGKITPTECAFYRHYRGR